MTSNVEPGTDLVVIPKKRAPRKAKRPVYDTPPAYKSGPKPRMLDTAFLYECGRLGMTQEEIGRLTGLSQSRISERLSKEPELREALDIGRGEIAMSLRRAQIDCALNGSVVAQIWVGKNLLGQRDSVKEVETRTDVQVTWTAVWGGEPPDELGTDDHEAVEDAEVSEVVGGGGELGLEDTRDDD